MGDPSRPCQDHAHDPKHEKSTHQVTLLPGRTGFPATRRERAERTEAIRSGSHREHAVLLRSDIGIGMAAEIKLIMAGLEMTDRDGKVIVLLHPGSSGNS
jgi:hypothetical protein